MGRLPRVTKRRDLIKRFKELGWSGPHKGVGNHPEFMAMGDRVQKIPNPHSSGRGSEIMESLLKAILQQAGISEDEWLGTDRRRTDQSLKPTGSAEDGAGGAARRPG